MERSHHRASVLLNHLAQSNELNQKIHCSKKIEPHEELNLKTLEGERKKASFNVRELTYLLDGGESATKAREIIMKELERDPVFTNDNYYDLTRPQLRLQAMRRYKRALEYYAKDGGNLELREARMILAGLHDASLDTKLGVHYFLFTPCIEVNGTDEQIEKFAKLALDAKILGCFAMTELGHGSFVQGVETVATYDKKTQEFVINTPSLTATKWWIGGASQTSQFCVCFARLFIDNKDHGVQIFIVQLRDLKDHSLLPGINIGDCGAKMGRDGLDNGWIQFTNVRIPRDQMLMRWAKVTPEGDFTSPPTPAIAYGVLIGARVSLIMGSSNWLKRAITIAIRYSVLRRQFYEGKSVNETQLLDYESHQDRLLPSLAGAYALHFTSTKMNIAYSKLLQELQKKDLTNLHDIHNTSAGLKAYSTWFTLYGIEEARQACGGHGYSKYNGLSQSFNDFAVMATWDGDNTVLALQTARYLIKSLELVVSGKADKLGESVSYLKDLNTVLHSKAPVKSEQDLLHPQVQLQLCGYIAMKIVSDTALDLQTKIGNGKSPMQAWNECTSGLLRCTKAHAYYQIISNFIAVVSEVDKPDLKNVLKLLCDLFTVYNLKKNLDLLSVEQYINSEQAKMITVKLHDLYLSVRPQAVSLVDAFNFSDHLINSPLGRYDGNIYKHYFEMVKRAPGAQEKSPFWEEIIKPMTIREMNK
eukprot:TRINITY_DN1592_c0_g1_i1.p1 TRINITY_DN1592_c0_g1~~TRINITY_DN1592_c0_g1_i1.p1  ORF type:complete len:702 (-),score=118.60 TRINITY_DN1592_c0_g1_i1:21-2126(-)